MEALDVLSSSTSTTEERIEFLNHLIELSRLQPHRGHLTTLNAVPRLLVCVQDDLFPLFYRNSSFYSEHHNRNPEVLRLCFKVLRNLCAGEVAHQEAFVCSNGVSIVASMLDVFRDYQMSEIVDTFQMALQLLGNVAGGGEMYKEAIWKMFFPSFFLQLARMEDVRILEPLSMMLYSCSHNDICRLEECCRGEGVVLLSTCLGAAKATDALQNQTSDWLCLLLSHLCLKKTFFRKLFENLGGITVVQNDMTVAKFSDTQVVLLDILHHILLEAQNSAEQEEESQLPMPKDSIAFLAVIIKQASKHFELGGCFSGSEPAAHVLQHCLEIVKVFAGWEGDTETMNRDMTRTLLLSELLSHGFIRLCIELLDGLGPPELIVKAMRKSGRLDTVAEDGVEAVVGNSNALFDRSLKLAYQGQRRDLVAVVANASYQNKAVQDEVRKLGGLFLILQQCVVDENNPFLREWGLWAVRNLLDGNSENCKEISEMQLKGSFTPVELSEAGLKVEMDHGSGRPKLVNICEM